MSGSLGRCDTCRYWKREQYGSSIAGVTEQGDVVLVEYAEGPDWGDCMLTECKSDDPEYRESLALAADGESYYAILRTHETFGCVQFDPKEG